jgi:hypothetical protein
MRDILRTSDHEIRFCTGQDIDVQQPLGLRLGQRRTKIRMEAVLDVDLGQGSFGLGRHDV